ncbi:unnamed protein product [Ceratitis capitata]|uniref:(Mediterranean fruit fly) hypothetical protein n=1 Tax=Ceratitis capitata TaxID=7213 RepID=A0A811URK8_CERCA|nr:unnamed protein product [Ceratitis capitata]
MPYFVPDNGQRSQWERHAAISVAFVLCRSCSNEKQKQQSNPHSNADIRPIHIHSIHIIHTSIYIYIYIYSGVSGVDERAMTSVRGRVYAVLPFVAYIHTYE